MNSTTIMSTGNADSEFIHFNFGKYSPKPNELNFLGRKRCGKLNSLSSILID